MLKYVFIISYVVGCLALKTGLGKNNAQLANETKKFPPYPGSVTLAPNNSSNDETSRSTREHATYTPSRISAVNQRLSSRNALNSTKQQRQLTSTEATLSANTTIDSNETKELIKDEEDDYNCTSMFGCLDCGTALVCRPTTKGLVRTFTLPCPHTAPYCSYASGTCSADPDPKCTRPDPFICPGDGYFPDSNNCTTYHTCNDFEAEMFKCAEGHVFDPIKNECSFGGNCSYIVNCAGVSESKLKMGDTQFFTYCSGGLPLLVSRCPGDYKLNMTSQVCEPLCEKDGLVADLEDCTKYYKCSTVYIEASAAVPIKEHLSCPIDEAYDSSSQKCVQRTTSTCKKLE